MEQNGRLFQINLSGGGVPKTGCHDAEIGALGLSGDQHRAPQHGGPRRAVCLYSLERITGLQAEGHPVFPGSTGENLTISGLDWDRVIPGAILSVGATLRLKITEYTTPCAKIASSFRDGQIERMGQPENPGWARVYASVEQEGPVAVGDSVSIED